MRAGRSKEVGSTDGPETLDRALCGRLRASDNGALRDLFYLIRDDLVRYVSSIVRDGTVAHDLVQDVFISLWDLRERLDPDCALRSYIFRMARNRAYRHLRDERLHAEKHAEILSEKTYESSGAAQPDAAADGQMLAAHLKRWVDGLPERQREALVLSRYQGLSHREISAVMGISARTVNNHILRALAHLDHKMQTLQPAGSRQ